MPETLKVEGKMNIHLISPTGVIVDDIADKILLPTENGPLMILKGRAPLFVQIAVGPMWIYNKGQRPICYYLSHGVAEIRRDICSVLAWGVLADKIDKERARRHLASVQEEREKIHSKAGRRLIDHQIEFEENLIKKPSLLRAPNFD